MWPYPWTHVGTPSHLGHMDRVAATMPSQAHAGAAQEAPDIGQWEGQDVPLVRPSSCNIKGGIPSSRRYLPTYLTAIFDDAICVFYTSVRRRVAEYSETQEFLCHVHLFPCQPLVCLVERRNHAPDAQPQESPEDQSETADYTSPETPMLSSPDAADQNGSNVTF